jgi:hypothetical protein
MSDEGNMRAIAAVRQMLTDYWKSEGDEYEARRASVAAPLDEVVAKVLADLKTFEKMYLAEVGGKDSLRAQIAKLKDDLADMRRPMTAQMEMQNRRIVALTAELDRFRTSPSADSPK